jgi:ferredoxin
VTSLNVPPIEPAVSGIKDRSSVAHLAHYWLRERVVEPWHDASRCCGVRACVAVCPTRCIEVRGGRPAIGPGCVRCFACHEACPHDAMRLRVPRAARGLFASRAKGLDVSKVFE